MQIIGFSFTKISVTKSPDFKEAANVNTNVEFTDITQEKTSLIQNITLEPLKISFKFNVSYYNEEESKKDVQERKNKEAEILFEGGVLLSTNNEETKEILKSWKKKDLPEAARESIFNLILRKCSTKALTLEDEFNIPTHIPLPAYNSPK